jgi:hypothetical protein
MVCYSPIERAQCVPLRARTIPPVPGQDGPGIPWGMTFTLRTWRWPSRNSWFMYEKWWICPYSLWLYVGLPEGISNCLAIIQIQSMSHYLIQLKNGSEQHIHQYSPKWYSISYHIQIISQYHFVQYIPIKSHKNILHFDAFHIKCTKLVYWCLL